jgi:hypothetical protein
MNHQVEYEELLKKQKSKYLLVIVVSTCGFTSKSEQVPHKLNGVIQVSSNGEEAPNPEEQITED